MDVFTADAEVTVGQECPVSEIGVADVRARKLDGGISDGQLYHAIVVHFGILAHVAIAMGIARSALDRRVRRTIELQAAVNGARRVLLRVARSHLQQALSMGASWAEMFHAGRVNVGAIASAGSHNPQRLPASAAARGDAATLRLALALHAGEPGAVMYCLSHLDLEGRYGKIRQDIPEEMFVGIEPEIHVDRMTAPTVGVEISDTSTAMEALVVEFVQQHSESAPTLARLGSVSHVQSSSPPRSGTANDAPTLDAVHAPTVEDRGNKSLRGVAFRSAKGRERRIAEKQLWPQVRIRVLAQAGFFANCAQPPQSFLASFRGSERRHYAFHGFRDSKNTREEGHESRQVCANPDHECRANPECRQTLLVLRFASHPASRASHHAFHRRGQRQPFSDLATEATARASPGIQAACLANRWPFSNHGFHRKIIREICRTVVWHGWKRLWFVRSRLLPRISHRHSH